MPENRTELHSSPVDIEEANVSLIIKLGNSFKNWIYVKFLLGSNLRYGTVIQSQIVLAFYKGYPLKYQGSRTLLIYSLEIREAPALGQTSQASLRREACVPKALFPAIVNVSLSPFRLLSPFPAVK